MVASCVKEGRCAAINATAPRRCADHNVAWQVRLALGLDHVAGAPSNKKDGLVYDIGLTGPASAIPNAMARSVGRRFAEF